ncbi:hypothetical protein [Moorena sp. SIO4G3]|uniref:hypothetical protein n=1 Tax=Moorena sp. SIO4G3 TaxID=2607821 RepID=UPI00142BBAE5|nr:hypothetical protein [Moorena sp. SIO4G3]NEO76910.1 hypothetical protein [Moorena sp. SIO4G3]
MQAFSYQLSAVSFVEQASSLSGEFTQKSAVSGQRSALWNRLLACQVSSLRSQQSAVSGQLCGTGF